MGATDGRPIIADDARALFGGTRDLSGALDESAATRLFAGSRLAADLSRQRLHVTALRRAAEQARST
jgi:hypothetical protein